MKRVAILLFLVASALHGQEAPTITIRKGETTNVACKRLAEAKVPLRPRCCRTISTSRDGLVSHHPSAPATASADRRPEALFRGK